jgi:glutathione S-transferase
MARIPGTRRLITITASHYCEKARWALDRAGVEYAEEGHYPNAHYLASFWVARTPMVPILVDAGKVITDSTAILHHVDSLIDKNVRLFPGEPIAREVERLEDRFDEVLGPATRLWAYWHWFDRTADLLRYAGHGTPRLERALAPFVVGAMKRMSSWRLAINQQSADKALATIRTMFAEVGARVDGGQRFLVGDRFSAADLAFAALAAPVLLPPGYGVPAPAPEEAPLPMRVEIERLRATQAGEFALRLYAEERHRSRWE